jgi:hypothetical protein
MVSKSTKTAIPGGKPERNVAGISVPDTEIVDTAVCGVVICERLTHPKTVGRVSTDIGEIAYKEHGELVLIVPLWFVLACPGIMRFSRWRRGCVQQI